MEENRKKLMAACRLVDEVASNLPDGEVMDDAYFSLKGAISDIYDADAILEESNA